MCSVKNIHSKEKNEYHVSEGSEWYEFCPKWYVRKLSYYVRIDKSNLSDQLLLYRNTSRNFISYGLHLMVVIPCRFSLKLFTKVPSDFTAL